MKFSCERCQTRYSIGDDKVRGKVLKIRCKTCGNIVVVREPGAESAVAQTAQGAQSSAQSVAQSGTFSAASQSMVTSSAPLAGGTGPLPPTPSRAPARPAGDIEWYVAIKGKQHGPAKRDDVVRFYREGKITERTYLWNEGMAQWTRIREIPAFAFLLSEPTLPKRPPPPPPSDEGGQAGAEIIPFDEAKRARDNATGVGSLANDPFAAVSSPMVGGDGAPRDSTRVFIMQAGLHNRGQKHRIYAYAAAGIIAVVGGVGFLDYKGVVEIPGLHSVVNVVTQKHDTYKAPDQVAWDTGDEDPKLKCKLMPNPAECEKKVNAENAIRHQKRLAAGGGIGGTGAGSINLEGAFGNGGGTASGDIARGTTDPGTGGPVVGLTDEQRNALISMKTDEKHPAAVRLTSPTTSLPQVEGAELDPKNVAAVVKENQPAIQDCVEKASKSGTIPHTKQWLQLSVEPNGRVSGAKFKDGATQASEVGECITRSARKWHFAAFPGPPTDADIPLILSAN